MCYHSQKKGELSIADSQFVSNCALDSPSFCNSPPLHLPTITLNPATSKMLRSLAQTWYLFQSESSQFNRFRFFVFPIGCSFHYPCSRWVRHYLWFQFWCKIVLYAYFSHVQTPWGSNLHVSQWLFKQYIFIHTSITSWSLSVVLEDRKQISEPQRTFYVHSWLLVVIATPVIHKLYTFLFASVEVQCAQHPNPLKQSCRLQIQLHGSRTLENISLHLK